MSKKIVVIGNCAAGISALEATRESDKDSKLTCISDELKSYYRCLISSVLSGSMTEQEIIIKDENYFNANNIEAIFGKKAIKVDLKKRQVVLEDKSRVDFDNLIIATGASSKELKDLKGSHKKGVFGFRNLKDTQEIIDKSLTTNVACVLGGGLIGLKAAYGLKKRKIDTRVIVRSGFLLSQVADRVAGDLLRDRFQENGIEVYTSTDVAEILGNGDVKAIKLGSGKVIATELIIEAKGVNANIDLIKESNIKINYGILTDEYLRTNIEGVYAAGDVAETFDIVRGETYTNALWPHAVAQGKIAAQNICGENVKYEGSIAMNSVEFFDLPICSIGITRPKQEDFEQLTCLDKEKSIYKKIVLKDNKIVGMVFAGKVQNSGVILKLIREKVDVSSFKDDLLSDSFSYAKVKDLIKEGERIYV